MTKIVTPAMISFTPTGKALQVVRFHAVIHEDHSVVADITKYPVQTGFEISNNVIRRNRKISIKALITNTPIAGARNAFEYSTNNAKTVFDTLQSLVQSAEPCEVLTNLGIYNPVIFTKFQTQQKLGMVDGIEINLEGQEVQVADTVRGTVPKVLSFSLLSASEADARADVLRNTGIAVCDCFELSEAKMKTGDDFKIEGVNEFGQTITTTYLNKGVDPVTGEYSYEVHTSDTKMYSPRDAALSATGTSLIDTTSGWSAVGNCLVDEGAGVLEDAATDLIDTAMGQLQGTLYGALYDTMHLSTNSYGQHLIHGGVGCMVRGITNFAEDNEFPYVPTEALPPTESIIESGKKLGKKLFQSDEDKAAAAERDDTEVITQIQCCETG